MIGCMMLACVGAVYDTWPMWGAEPSHVCVQLTKGAISTTPVIKWGFRPPLSATTVKGQFSAIADVDGEGRMEVVIGATDGVVYCLTGLTGGPKWQFFSGSWGSPSSSAAGDLDGDGQMELVVSHDNTSRVYCLSGLTGTVKWSVGGITGYANPPTLADVDGDGQLEVLVGSDDHYLYCLSGSNGAQKWKFLTQGSLSYKTPAVGDVDSDGRMEVLICSEDSTLYCLAGSDATLKWSFKPSGESITCSSPALADVDLDSRMEVVVGSGNAYGGHTYCLAGSDGSIKWSSGSPPGP